MKTAEEWNWEYAKICASDPAVHGQLLPNPQNIAFIEQIQLEAFKAGMTRAADICDKDFHVVDNYVAKTILTDRDNLNKLP